MFHKGILAVDKEQNAVYDASQQPNKGQIMTNFINFIQPTNYALLIKKPEISDLSKEDQENFTNELEALIKQKELTTEEKKVYLNGISEAQAKIHSFKTSEWKKKIGGYIKKDHPELTKRIKPEAVGEKVYEKLVEGFQNKKITCFVVRGENAQEILKNGLKSLREIYIKKLPTPEIPNTIDGITNPFPNLVHRTDGEEDGLFQAALEIINLMPEFAKSNTDFKEYVANLYFATISGNTPPIIKDFIENILGENYNEYTPIQKEK